MSNAPLDDFRRGNTKFYLKLFLADAIPRNYDTCLFIDSDLLAVNDFDLLYSFPLHKPIAAAIDQDYMLIDAKTENLLHGYFNTGVFILDLHDARSNFLEDTFLQDMVTTYYRIVDQDFLNIFYKYKFDYLSLTTNVLEKEILPLEYNKKSAKNRLQRLRAAQKDGYQNKVLFIHFTALCSYKP